MPGREMLDLEINHIWFPHMGDKESYGLHVRMRSEIFCYLIYNVAHLCLKYQPTRPYEYYLSDIAEVQVGSGLRFAATATKDKLSLDAAHFCNTSFRADEFMTHVGTLGKTAQQLHQVWERCNTLKTMSGATSFQLQSDNVGPDKLIDSYQTDFKNAFLQHVKSTGNVESGRITYTRFVTGLRQWLLSSKANSVINPAASGYAGAMEAKQILANIDLTFLSWSVEAEFGHIQQAIAALP